MNKNLGILLASAILSSCDAGEPIANQETEQRFGHQDPELELVAAFTPLDNPESAAVLSDNSIIISMALTGELRKIDPQGQQSTLAVIPIGVCAPNPFPGIMGALAVDQFDNIYVGAAACELENKGIYRVSPQGDVAMIAALPAESLPNGIAVKAGRVYLADSASTKIWRAPIFGDGSMAEVWTDEPLLADPIPGDPIPGANGLQFYKQSVWVANAGAHTIVEIPFRPGGLLGGDLRPRAGKVGYGPEGTGAEHVTPSTFQGCDDFAFDIIGRIYCATDPFQTVELIDKNGSVAVLWDAEDGLDGPTAAVFGVGSMRKTLYITNASFPFFPGTGNGPSLMKAEMHLPGWPFR